MKKKILSITILILILLCNLSVYATDKQAEIPSKYDLRNDINIRVENQGQRGWCGAFATTKTFETYILKTRGIDYNLSEAYLSYSEAPYFGGDVEWKTDITTARALVSNVLVCKYAIEDDIPNRDYEFNETNKKKFNDAPTMIKNYDLEIFDKKDEKVESIKKQIMNNGGVWLDIDIDTKWYNPSTNAIYCNELKDEEVELNTREQVLNYVEETTRHAVTIIGWDDNYSRNNFGANCRPENNGAWLVLNSWGSSWGNNGTAWVSYEDIYFKNSTPFGVKSIKLRGEKPNVEFTYSQRDGYVQAIIKADEKIENIEGWELGREDKVIIKNYQEQFTPYTLEIHSKYDDTSTIVEVNIPDEEFNFENIKNPIHIEGKYKINSEDLKLVIIILIVILIILFLIIKYCNNKKQRKITLEDNKNKKQNSKLKKYIYIMIPIIIILIFLMQNKTSLEDTARIDIQTEFTAFVDKIRNNGKITNTDYNELLEQINANGNTYELSIGIQTLDEYTKNKIYDEDTQVGENISYKTYTGQVLDSLNSTGIYLLQEGSIIKIELINSKSKEVVASQSGMVTKSGN